MLLAIIEMGYQSCWYEGHITDEDRISYQMAQILGVPDEFELVCFLPVGIVETKTLIPEKNLSKNVHGSICFKQQSNQYEANGTGIKMGGHHDFSCKKWECPY